MPYFTPCGDSHGHAARKVKTSVGSCSPRMNAVLSSSGHGDLPSSYCRAAWRNDKRRQRVSPCKLSCRGIPGWRPPRLLVQVAACAGSDVVLCKARRRLEACTRQLSGRPAQKHIGVMLCSDARIARCCRLYGGRQFWGARLQSAINSPSTTQFISGATSKVAPTANSWTRYTCLLSSKAPYRAIMCSWCSVLWIWISRATCISHTALALQVVLDKRSGSGLPANSSPSCQLRIGWRHAQLAKRLVYGSAQRRP